MKLGLKFDKERLLPLILTGIIVLIDQCSKAFIAAKWPISDENIIADVFNNGFLQIMHRRNDAIAFSLGRSMPDSVKPALFIVVPLLVLGVLLWYYLKSSDFTRMQRWAVAGILGGGIGNIIDRIFRPLGVVDFIDVKFYGLFGFDRWPTFNVADSSVVVCCILLFISIIIDSVNKKPEAAK
jgi:signal peptidase II